jgi:hypothetical protein
MTGSLFTCMCTVKAQVMSTRHRSTGHGDELMNSIEFYTALSFMEQTDRQRHTWIRRALPLASC